MTDVFLVRHALCDPMGKSLPGRAPGVRLNEAGRLQAEALGTRLGGIGLAAVYSGPLERARETAAAIAGPGGHRFAVDERLDEVGYGDWTGATIDSLRGRPAWSEFNSYRSGTRIPGGELAAEVQQRMVGALIDYRERHPTDRIAVVSHAEPIRLAIAYMTGIPIDLAHRLEIRPAGIAHLRLDRFGVRLLALNLGEVRLDE